jgi:hypothetical protein
LRRERRVLELKKKSKKVNEIKKPQQKIQWRRHG